MQFLNPSKKTENHKQQQLHYRIQSPPKKSVQHQISIIELAKGSCRKAKGEDPNEKEQANTNKVK